MSENQETKNLPYRKRMSRLSSVGSAECLQENKAQNKNIENIANSADNFTKQGIMSKNSAPSEVPVKNSQSNIQNIDFPIQREENDAYEKTRPGEAAINTATIVSTVADMDVEIIQDSAITVTANSESTSSVRKRVEALYQDQDETKEKNNKKVDIYVLDSGPRWFEAEGCTITKTIVPKRLPEAFNFLPISGKPKNRDELPEFLDEKLQEFVGSGLNEEEFFKISQVCSTDLLKTGKEPTAKLACAKSSLGVFNDEMPERETSQPWDGHQLHLHKKFRLRNQKDHTNNYSRYMKYRGIRLIPLSHYVSEETENNLEPTLEPGQDVIFRVRIYRPFPFVMGRQSRTRNRHSVFSCDVVLLGRQRLTDLRDRFVCSNDVDMRIDVSERIDHPVPTHAKDIFPSGFLFINNVFYVDNRPGCHDTSERIREWGLRRGLGDFPVRDMAACTLDQLHIKLGHPEVYMHQGNCEHLFTFSELRLLGALDPLSAVSYPCHTALSQYQCVYCMTCAEFAAKWVTTNCDRVPFDPAYFCDPCLRLYLYKEGKKISDFQVYSYRGNDINMLKPQG